MLRVLGLVALTLFIAHATPASAQDVADPLSAIAGRWQIVNTSTGAVSTSCDAPQVFTVSTDGRYVDLEERAEAETHRAHYIVLQGQPGRLLMFIEGETRLTESGEPVLWWAVFSDRDHFRWRRYDWPPTAQTTAQWGRCP